MKLDDVIEGLAILRPYFKPERGGYNVTAEWEGLHICKTDYPVSEGDRAKLIALDWDEYRGCWEAHFSNALVNEEHERKSNPSSDQESL